MTTRKSKELFTYNEDDYNNRGYEEDHHYQLLEDDPFYSYYNDGLFDACDGDPSAYWNID